MTARESDNRYEPVRRSPMSAMPPSDRRANRWRYRNAASVGGAQARGRRAHAPHPELSGRQRCHSDYDYRGLLERRPLRPHRWAGRPDTSVGGHQSAASWAPRHRSAAVGL